ncbi:efflux RND transporter periplasmic adaptor subunit [Megasphaera coli]|uniref:efflux RND transporter periplasmic adaptor subunit n=1 Tax=Colibacter massiliensis TaxID=1852379 RepID=UPI00094E955A|nr:efflux RND transporter periplasmic adaptor subunit [Colibacter massiliensis]
MWGKHKFLTVGAAIVAAAVFITGCGGQQGGEKQPVSVNTYRVTAEDTIVPAEYSGVVSATDKVPVMPKISGRVLEKYVQGGQPVAAGQALFRLDSRSYQAALNAAKANEAQAAANLANQELNLRRYRTLADQDAISMQTVTDQEAATAQQSAALEANSAQVAAAQDNMDDTIVYAPFSGTLNVDDVPVGTFATAGSTALVTISSTNPVFVEFSISEAEYLEMVKAGNGSPTAWGDHLKLRLSDGTEYAYEGHVAQVNHGMDGSSGSIIVKAVFDNPENLLLPGMYATVLSDAQVKRKAVTVPQRAVQQTLGKYFVSVIDEDGNAKQKEVKVGQQIGKFWLITDGLQDGDIIIVDGYQKANGAKLTQHLLTKNDILNPSDADGQAK